MRIISGSHRGKIIKAPSRLPVRPTTDMAKESLFNILMNYFDLDSVRVLDVFAGTGNLSYEFASRGAEVVVSVDENRDCIQFITRMAQEMGFAQLSARRNEALTYLRRNTERFHIAMADPPYDWDGHAELVELATSGRVLLEDGLFVLEHSREHNFSEHSCFLESRRYGNVHFSFFRPAQQ